MFCLSVTISKLYTVEICVILSLNFRMGQGLMGQGLMGQGLMGQGLMQTRQWKVHT